MNEWVEIVYQVKSGNYKKQIKEIMQPKVQEKPIDADKYRTDFVKEVVAIENEKYSKASGKQVDLGNNLANVNNNEQVNQSRVMDFSGMWLTQEIDKKEKSMMEELARRHMNSEVQKEKQR